MGGVVQSRCVCQLKGHLSETWKPALKKSQLLLMEFATDGVNKSIDKAIKQAGHQPRTLRSAYWKFITVPHSINPCQKKSTTLKYEGLERHPFVVNRYLKQLNFSLLFFIYD
jgi:hypothetical protein